MITTLQTSLGLMIVSNTKRKKLRKSTRYVSGFILRNDLPNLIFNLRRVHTRGSFLGHLRFSFRDACQRLGNLF